MGMNEREAAELGGLLARLSAAIERATAAEKVYVLAYGELFPHFHLLLHPRRPDAPPDRMGPALFQHRTDLIDVESSVETAGRIAAALNRPGGR
jgi:hypothetical protein